MVPWFGGKLLLSGVELMLSQKKKGGAHDSNIT
jgi:hypothetical protein